MEAKHPPSSTSPPEDTKQQDSSDSHPPPSRSSQTYTGAPSTTGDGASGRRMTATTATFDPIADQAALDHQYHLVPSPDHHQDLSHIGSWDTTIEPLAVIGINSMLSPNNQFTTAVNAMDAEIESDGPVAEGEDTKEEAVELLRASLHRKV